MPFPEVVQQQPIVAQGDGPVIVNGSTPQTAPTTSQSFSSIMSAPAMSVSADTGNSLDRDDTTTESEEPQTPERKSKELADSKVIVLPLNDDIPQQRSNFAESEPGVGGTAARESVPCAEMSSEGSIYKATENEGVIPWFSSSSNSAGLRARPPPPLNLSPANTGTIDDSSLSTAEGRPVQISPLVAIPLLSPVAELQSPSPTSSRGHGSPRNEAKASVNANRNVQIANGKLNDSVNAIVTNGVSTFGHKLMPENPQLPMPLQAQNSSTGGSAYQPGEWQQATRKHRKGKSQGGSINVKDALSNGDTSAAIENERKGG